MIKELQKFRTKYPQYKDIDDATLASKLASKYPDAYGALPSKVAQESTAPLPSDIMQASRIQEPTVTQQSTQQSPILTQSARAVSQGNADVQQPYATDIPKPSQDQLVDAGRIIVPGVLAGAGAVAGMPFSPLASVAASGGGYALGQELMDVVENALGRSTPKSVDEEATGTIKRIAEGAAYETLGIGFANTLKGIPKVYNKLMPKIPLTIDSAKKVAGKVYVAATDSGYLFTETAEKAAQLEKETGVKFTRGQLSGDRSTLRFENKVGGDELYQLNRENTDQLLSYIEKIKGSGSIDDISRVLGRSKESLNTLFDTATDRANKEALKFTTDIDVQQLGGDFINVAKEGEKMAKDQASKLYSEIPDLPIKIDRLREGFRKLVSPEFAKEESTSIPKIIKDKLSFMNKGEYSGMLDAQGNPIMKIRETLQPKDLQGWRSELLDKSRSAKAGIKGNRRQAARLDRAVQVIDDVLLDSSSADPAINQKLKEANTFYKANVVDKYYKGAVGDILGSGGERVPSADVVSKFFKPGDKGLTAADDFIKVFGNSDTSKAALTGYMDSQMLRASTNNFTGVFEPKGLSNWLAKYKPALSKFGLTDRYNTLQKAQAVAANASVAKQVFDKSIASTMLKANVDTQARAMLKGDPTANINSLLSQIGSNDQALSGLQNAVIDDIIAQSKSITTPSLVNATKFANETKRYAPIIRKLYDTPGGKEKVKGLFNVRDALISLESKVTGGKLDYSTVFNNTVSSIMITQRVTHNRALSLAVGLLSPVVKQGEESVAKFLTRAAVDPEFAQTLIMATQKNVPMEVVASRVTAQLAALGIRTTATKGENNE